MVGTRVGRTLSLQLTYIQRSRNRNVAMDNVMTRCNKHFGCDEHDGHDGCDVRMRFLNKADDVWKTNLPLVTIKQITSLACKVSRINQF